MSANAYLEVDDTIITKNLTLPENRKDDIEEMIRQFDTKPSILVSPLPGACIKAKTDTGEKVFLNVCTTDKIPAPEDISDAQLFKILGEDAPSFTIPMSIGNERLECDKGGSPCKTYDIAINTTYFEKCQKNKNFWIFTISVILDGVSNKFNKVLAEDYVVLKNRKVMGKLQQHRIEQREVRKPVQELFKKPLIEEISDSLISKSEIPVKQESVKSTQLGYVLLRQPREGPIANLISLCYVPKGIKMRDINVLMNSDRIVVTYEGHETVHDISVPCKIDAKKSEAYFDESINVLRINTPIHQ